MKFAKGLNQPRIILAVALSALLHLLLLWQWPRLELPTIETELPPLQAKLEPLPKLAAKPVVRKPRRKPGPRPQAIPEAAVAQAIPAIPDTPAAESAVDAASAVSAIAASEPIAPEPIAAEEPVTHPLLPKHAQLHYAVQYGAGTFKVGEVIHVLENIDGRYTLRSATQTTGLVGLFKSFQMTQTSTGSVGKLGFQPDSYEEIKRDSSGTQTSSAKFDWAAHRISFNDGKEMPLPKQAQDVLSLPYQLSQLPLNADGIRIAMSNGRNIAPYYIAVGDEGSITTAMGELRTVTLSKVHGPNEDGLIIWLALEYRLLPVKILYLDKSGVVSANMVITDIRVSDE